MSTCRAQEVFGRDTRWDSFVQHHSPEALFQSSYWHAVQERVNARTWMYRYTDGPRVVAQALVIKVCAKRGTFLHIRHGPVFAYKSIQYFRPVLEHLINLAKRERALFVRVSPLIADTPQNRNTAKALGLRPAAIHAMDAEVTLLLDITRSEDEIFRSFRKSTRYEIRKSERAGASIDISVNVRDLSHFFRLYEKTARRKHFVRHTGIQEEFEEFVSSGKAALFLGRFRGEVVASAIILYYNRRAIYHHGATVPSDVSVSHLLQWKSILEAKRRGCAWYNFWGVVENASMHHPWYGTTLFKLGFGGRIVRYMHAHDYPVSPWYIVPRTIEMLRKIKRGY